MDLDARIDNLAILMEERLGIRGDGFEEKFARAGRRLPRRLRHEGAVLVEARKFAAHPKLGRRVDERRLRKAVRALERHLERIDGTQRRITLTINWLAGNAFNVLVVFALTLAVLAWRGLI